MISTDPGRVARTSPSDDIFSEPLWLAALILTIAATTILAALAFQHLGGYQPCALCLKERVPYYVGVPLAAATLIAVWLRAPRPVLLLLFAALALVMLYGATLGAYHAGVEWQFWPGPASCAPSVGMGSAADMLNQLETEHAPSCTEATWRLFGLSFAGWNAAISAVLVVLAMLGLRRSAAYGSSSASQ